MTGFGTIFVHSALVISFVWKKFLTDNWPLCVTGVDIIAISFSYQIHIIFKASIQNAFMKTALFSSYYIKR